MPGQFIWNDMSTPEAICIHEQIQLLMSNLSLRIDASCFANSIRNIGFKVHSVIYDVWQPHSFTANETPLQSIVNIPSDV